MMEEKDVLPKATGSTKRKRNEISQGRKKQKIDNIRPEKQGRSPTVSRRIQNPEDFYSEGWAKTSKRKTIVIYRLGTTYLDAEKAET